MKRQGAFFQLVFHFNWATKNRAPMLTPTIEARVIRTNMSESRRKRARGI
ncbi:MAG: hypothetical protein HY070_01205 [Chloroflexi bacterium]|nr:hypothetical protein [Chloroflexota bacterium]